MIQLAYTAARCDCDFQLISVSATIPAAGLWKDRARAYWLGAAQRGQRREIETVPEFSDELRRVKPS